jgi:hypothetical protein
MTINRKTFGDCRDERAHRHDALIQQRNRGRHLLISISIQ